MRDFLADVQFKRLWQRFAEGRELADIAAGEGVSITAVASSISVLQGIIINSFVIVSSSFLLFSFNVTIGWILLFMSSA